MLEFYGYKKCGTSRKAQKWLDRHGVEYRFIDITENPPPATLLRKIVKSGDYELKELFNRSGGEYRALNLKEKLPTLKPAEAVALLAGNGKLCKRPIVSDGKHHTVGFDESVFAATWG
jgi:arsenate reductase